MLAEMWGEVSDLIAAFVSWLTANIVDTLAVLLASLAAWFAYKNHERRPKLKLYIGDKDNRVLYSDEQPRLAYVHATMANVGKMAAHNVYGRIEFEPVGRVCPDKRIPRGNYPKVDQHIIDHSDNWATLYLGSLPVSRSRAAEGTLHARSFEASPRHFIIPVRVLKEGQTRLSYWFVSEETDGIKGTVTLGFPKRTPG